MTREKYRQKQKKRLHHKQYGKSYVVGSRFVFMIVTGTWFLTGKLGIVSDMMNQQGGFARVLLIEALLPLILGIILYGIISRMVSRSAENDEQAGQKCRKIDFWAGIVALLFLILTVMQIIGVIRTM